MAQLDELSPCDTNEARRIATLHALKLLDSAPQQEFDSLVALAAELLDAPIAMMSLIDERRAWIKARHGLEVQEMPRTAAFCDVAVQDDTLLVVPDLSLDPRFADNPYVTAPDGARFYAGQPIHALDEDGTPYPIGTLCVVDAQPRTLSDAGARALAHLGALAEALIAARSSALKAIQIATEAERMATDLGRQQRILRQAERMAMIGSWRLTLADNALEWSEGVFRIHALTSGEMPPMDNALEFYPPGSRERVSAALANTIETGAPFDIEEDFVTAAGDQRRVRARGECTVVNGQPVDVIGVFQDITDRHELETMLRRSAETDGLTGLANRAAFQRALDAAMDRAHVDRTPLILAMIDLDGFKAINDTLGHVAGDDVLRDVGRALQADWLMDSVAGRLGGDEFAVIVRDPALTGDPLALAERIEASLRTSIRAGGVTLASAGTVGLAALEPDCLSVRDFVHRADTVLYAAKRARVGERRIADRRRAAG